MLPIADLVHCIYMTKNDSTKTPEKKQTITKDVDSVQGRIFAIFGATMYHVFGLLAIAAFIYPFVNETTTSPIWYLVTAVLFLALSIGFNMLTVRVFKGIWKFKWWIFPRYLG